MRLRRRAGEGVVEMTDKVPGDEIESRDLDAERLPNGERDTIRTTQERKK